MVIELGCVCGTKRVRVGPYPAKGNELMRRLLLVGLIIGLVASVLLVLPGVRSRVRAIIRPEPPPRITPLALNISAATAVPTRTSVTSLTPTFPRPTRTVLAVTPVTEPVRVSPTATPLPTAIPTPTPIMVNGRTYAAYIPAATKAGQFYQYSCEFDAAWVILATYGFDLSGDELIAAIDHDQSVELYIEETAEGFVIHGGDITNAYSGDYTKNFLARSTATAMRKVFERYGLTTTLVQDPAGIEAALQRGWLVWIKNTVDFKPWRPAIWKMPDGRTHRTVLGNDHAVVVIGYNDAGVAIRDVLGPTSSNWQRPYEYEVDWATFLAVWEAQSFDGLAVKPPSTAR